LLAAGYTYRILTPALSDGKVPIERPPKRYQEVIAFVLTVIALALGFAPQSFYDFIEIGRPLAAMGLS
jgi:multicomponent Na+:H+ antiporter subunit D